MTSLIASEIKIGEEVRVVQTREDPCWVDSPGGRLRKAPKRVLTRVDEPAPPWTVPFNDNRGNRYYVYGDCPVERLSIDEWRRLAARNIRRLWDVTKHLAGAA